MHPFYKLTLPEVISLSNQLRYADFRTLLYLKCSNPLATGPIEVSTIAIAEAFDLDPRTVSRCLKRLELKGLIGEVIITRASITILPFSSLASESGSGDPQSGSGDPKSGSGDPLPTAETLETSLNSSPDQIRESLDPQDQPLEEEEEESKFSYKALDPLYREFLRKKAKNLPTPPNNLHGWIVSAAKKKTYLGEFESLQGAKNVPPPVPVAENFESAADYFKWLNSRQRND